MKDPDVAVAMDVHPDDLAPAASIHARRERRPSCDESIRIGELGWFRVRRLSGAGRRCEQRSDGSTREQHPLHCFFPPICTSKPSGSGTWKLPSVTRIFKPRRFSSASTAGLTVLSVSQLASV